MAETRKKLTDILNGNGGSFKSVWDTTAAANEMGPLPAGEYLCRTLAGELFQSKGGTPGYKLTLEVVEGDYTGRRCWHDFWLSPAALPMSKRDLAKLGITSPDQLERPLPAVFRLLVKLTLRKDDNGNEQNKVARFELAGVEPPEPFAPASPRRMARKGGRHHEPLSLRFFDPRGDHGTRRLVDHAAAFLGYATLDESADVHREAYLSAFSFGEDFRQLLYDSGTCKGFAGPCWSRWLWFDLDRKDNLQLALDDTRRLAAGLVERYRLDDDALLLFFSGAKGLHVGLPTSLWLPDPSADFHRTARRFTEAHAERFGIGIDASVYDRVRPFRARIHATRKPDCTSAG